MVTQQQNVPVLRFPEFSGAWTEKQLGAIGAIKTGPFGSLLHEKDYVDKGTPIITVEHLGELGIKHKNFPLVSAEDKERLKGYILKVDDIVFSRVGSVDRNSIIKPEEDGWLFSGRLLRIRTESRHAHAKFLSFSFQQVHTKYKIRSVAVGQTMPSLNTKIISFFCVFFPSSILEQQKIASFLSSVDTKIEQLGKKKALLEQYKKGIMQKLFSQEIRFKDEQRNEYPDWEERKLGDVLDYEQPTEYLVENSVYDDGYKTPVLTAGKTFLLGYTNEKTGVFIDKLPTIIFDDFTTAFKYVDFPFKAKSSAMKMLVSKSKCLNMKFVYEAMKRVRFPLGEHKRYWISEYQREKISYPSKEEQQKIASFLSAIDKKIELIAQQLEQARTFKKGLLQQMFI